MINPKDIMPILKKEEKEAGEKARDPEEMY